MTFRSLNRLALVAALAFACVAFAGPVRAQAPTPGAIAAAKELVALKGAAAMFDPLIPGVVESAKNTFVPTHPQLVTQLNEVAAMLRKEYEPKRAEILEIGFYNFSARFGQIRGFADQVSLRVGQVLRIGFQGIGRRRALGRHHLQEGLDPGRARRVGPGRTRG